MKRSVMAAVTYNYVYMYMHTLLKVSVYPKFDHFSKKCFSLFQIDLTAIFHSKKLYEKRLILSKVINEKCFFPLITSN